MQVDHLVIIVLTHDANDESAKCGQYLYDKVHTGNHKAPTSKTLVHIDTRSPVFEALVGDAKEFTSNRQFLDKYARADGLSLYHDGKLSPIVKFVQGATEIGNAVKDSTNVGVYLVFHCSQSGVPYVFDMAASPRRTEIAMFQVFDSAASAVVKMVLSLGIVRIRKLCMVACTTAKKVGDFERGFLTSLCKQIAAASFTQRPLVAGWDDYLTVGKSGHKVVSNDKPAKDARSEHKFIAEYKSGVYEIKRYEAAGWSDKEQLATNLGASSTLNV